MVVVTRPVDESIENELQALDDEFQELKTKLSDVRKKGRDTSLAEILTIDFTPKLKMAKATYDRKDIDELRHILDDIKKEIDLADNGSDFEHIDEMIKEAYQFLREGKIKEAKILYPKITKIYKLLDKDLQRTVYSACLDLNDRIEKGKKELAKGHKSE